MELTYNTSLIAGKVWEDEVEDWLKRTNRIYQRNTFYDKNGDETYQFVIDNGRQYNYPDFTLDGLEVGKKVFLEVKSKSSYYVNTGYCSKIPVSRKEYVTMEKKDWESYSYLSSKYNMDLVAIFIQPTKYKNPDWLYAKKDYLESNYFEDCGIYGNDNKRYLLWLASGLKKLNIRRD